MVLEISNIFGGGVDTLTEGSPLLGIIKSPYGISLIIVIIIMVIWSMHNVDEDGYKNIIKSGLYMLITTVLLIMVHDHIIYSDKDNTLEEEEVEHIMPKPVELEDNIATLERIRNNFNQPEEE